MCDYVCVQQRSLRRNCCGITGATGPRGANGINGLSGPTGPTGPANQTPEVSFSVDKVGTQLISGTDSVFTYTTLQNWGALTPGRHNTGEFNVVSGLFTAPRQGRYHFVGAAQAISTPQLNSFLGLRIMNLTANTVLAEERINASSIFNATIGISMHLAEYTSLNAGDKVGLEVTYVIDDPPADITIGSNIGLTRFEGYLVREVIFDT